MAGVGVRGECLLPTVSEAFEFSAQAQPAAQLGIDGSCREYVIRTARDAFFLAFAAITIDDRAKNTGRLFAVRLLDIHQRISSVTRHQPTG